MTGFTDRVRQELSRIPVDTEAGRRGELAAILRLAGSVHRRSVDGATTTFLEVASPSGAVARRTFTLLRLPDGYQPQLWVRAPGGVRTVSTYGLTVALDAVAADVELVDGDGRLVMGLPGPVSREPVAGVRGALLAAARLSSPGRPPHLEFGVTGPEVAGELAALLLDLVGRGTATAEDPPRVVIKSGGAIGDLLELAGATEAAGEWEEQRRRRQLRNQATRLANADAANLRRSAEASSDQVAVVQDVVDRLGWSQLEEPLREVALVRLANPSASLAELAELCDISKSAVHRRLAKLAELHRVLDHPDERE